MLRRSCCEKANGRGRRRVKVPNKNFPSTRGRGGGVYTVVNHMKSIYVRLPRLIRYTESLMHQRVRKGIKVYYVDVPRYSDAFDNVVTVASYIRF